MSERRETAGVTMRLIVEFVRRAQGEAAVTRMLELAGETRPLEVLEDESLWSSYEQKIALFVAAAEVTGNPRVAREIGESVIDFSVGTSLRVALGLLGSPKALFRVVARASAKFSNAGEMRADYVHETSARLRYRCFEGFTPSQYDCDYATGLLTQVPVLFGLPPATVEHDECQLRGDDACVYALRWHQLARLPWRRRRHALAADAVLVRLHQLQETLSDLVATTEVDEVLDAVSSRAGTAVNAERFVLAARVSDGEAPRVRYDGFDAERAHEVAEALLAGRPVPVHDDQLLVVDVRSSTRDYGRLAAFASNAFFDHEHDLLAAYGQLAATALDTVCALSDAEDRRRVAEAMLGLAGRLQRAHTSEDVAAAVAEEARPVVQADVATTLLFRDDKDVLHVVGSAGWPEDYRSALPEVTVRCADTPELADIIAHPDQPRVYDDQCDDPFLRAMLQAFETKMIAVVPIRGEERLHGVLIAGWLAGSCPPRVDEPLLRKLRGLADQTTNALDKVELLATVHRQASTDPLTGTANRRLFMERVGRAAGDAHPERPVALLFIDLDGFKGVNDTLGHAAGDELLNVVAERLRRCVRQDDLVGRLGGDEFTLLAAVEGPEAATELADRVVARIVEPISIQGQTLQVRCSIGVVVVSEPVPDASEVLRDADAAMYAAKKAGGNRCVLFDSAGVRTASRSA